MWITGRAIASIVLAVDDGQRWTARFARVSMAAVPGLLPFAGVVLLVQGVFAADLVFHRPAWLSVAVVAVVVFDARAWWGPAMSDTPGHSARLRTVPLVALLVAGGVLPHRVFAPLHEEVERTTGELLVRRCSDVEATRLRRPVMRVDLNTDCADPEARRRSLYDTLRRKPAAKHGGSG